MKSMTDLTGVSESNRNIRLLVPKAKDESNRLKITEVTCKNALVKSGIEGVDYALNPYTGCQHACVYCYAEFMKKYTNHPEPWGEFVDVKINLADRLSQQVKKNKPGTVMIGTVTDAYQPVERKFQLTRQCLEMLSGTDFPVFIQTKSDLILRDIDVLKKIENKEVGMTITCPDAYVEKLFEPGASNLERRFKALAQLKDSGIPTFVFVGPILPYFSDSKKSLLSIFDRLDKIGIKHVYLDKMNYLKGKFSRIKAILRDTYPGALPFYESVMNQPERYEQWLKANLTSVLADFSLDLDPVF
jgi:DNA repair photolyase